MVLFWLEIVCLSLRMAQLLVKPLDRVLLSGNNRRALPGASVG